MRQVDDSPKALLPIFRSEGLQIGSLALTDDLHPAGLDVGIVAGKRQAWLLHSRMRDAVLEAHLAAEHSEMEIGELGPQELGDFDVWSVGIWVSFLHSASHRSRPGRQLRVAARRVGRT